MAYIRRNLTLILFALTLAVAAAMVVFASQSVTQSESTLLDAGADSLSTEGWSYADDNGRFVPIDEISRRATGTEGKVLRLYTALKGSAGTEQVVCIQTKNEFVRAFVEDELIYEYSYDTDGFSRERGTVWNLISLPSDNEDDVLCLELTPAPGHQGTDPYQIYMGSRQAVVQGLLLQNLLYIIVCGLMLFTSFLLLIFFLVRFIRKKESSKGYLFLGAFVLLATLWTASDALLFQFFMSSKTVSFFIFNYSFLLMPIPFAMFMGTVFRKNKLYFDIISVGGCLYFLLRAGLYAAGILAFQQVLWVIHLFMALVIISAVYLCVKNRGDREHKYTYLAIVVLTVVSAASLLVFYLDRSLTANRANYSTYFYVGILLFFVICLFDVLRKTYKKQRLADKAQFFEQQAKTDSLTGLRNRAAFEAELKNLDMKMNTLKSVCVIVFDLNNLKKTNDNYGHNVGDELLVNTFGCVFSCFGRRGNVFRTGGDEAVVIMTDMEKGDVDSAVEEFERAVKEYNEERMIPIDVAYGKVFFENADAQGLRATDFLRLADAEMYADKKKKKGNEKR